MDLNTILEGNDFHHPLFADFILDKYEDIKDTDPESAKKIETQVFNERFLKQVLDHGDGFLRSNLLATVPESCFLPLAGEVERVLQTGTDRGIVKNASRILRSNAPERFERVVSEKCRQCIDAGGIQSYLWYAWAGELPHDLLQSYFEATYPSFMGSPDALKTSDQYGWILEKTFFAAVRLGHPDAPLLAGELLERMILIYEDGSLDFYEWCSDLFHILADSFFDGSDDFELKLFFAVDSGSVSNMPEALNRIYEAEWTAGALFDFFKILVAAEDFPDFSDVSGLAERAGDKPLASLMRVLAADHHLAETLTLIELRAGLKAVFAALLWQAARRSEADMTGLDREALSDVFCLEASPLPFLAEFRCRLRELAPKEGLAVLKGGLKAGLQGMISHGADGHAMTNFLSLVPDSPDPVLIPFVGEAFTHRFYSAIDAFFDALTRASVALGDGMIEHLDAMMDRIPDYRLTEVLEVIRQTGSARAERLLTDRFDLFLKAYKADALNTAQSLVSASALEKVAHKIGKGQSGIDELHIIVKTFRGEGGKEVQELLAGLKTKGERFEEGLSGMDSGRPADVLSIELECSRCKDVSDYLCRNIMVSVGGKGYVAEEKTCIACGRTSEFRITKTGSLALTAELMRQNTQSGEDETPFSAGAVKVVNTSFFGRPMSIPDGIALYKEKIMKQPRKTDLYIGLGNAYRGVNQAALSRVQYEKAIERAPFYIEAYMGLAELDFKKGAYASGLDWLEKGRAYLARPLICRDTHLPPGEVMERYLGLHDELLKKTGAKLAPILGSECIKPGVPLTKLGSNEKCPCGSGKKYKKCCRGKH